MELEARQRQPLPGLRAPTSHCDNGRSGSTLFWISKRLGGGGYKIDPSTSPRPELGPKAQDRSSEPPAGPDVQIGAQPMEPMAEPATDPIIELETPFGFRPQGSLL